MDARLEAEHAKWKPGGPGAMILVAQFPSHSADTVEARLPVSPARLPSSAQVPSPSIKQIVRWLLKSEVEWVLRGSA